MSEQLVSNKVPLHDAAGVETVRRELRIDPRLIRRLRILRYKKFVGVEQTLAALPPEVREAFTARVTLQSLKLEQRLDSGSDGATKLIFRTLTGQLVESVLLRADTGRVALCISSQVGCAANCDFCATGKMGFRAHLSAAEILDQVLIAGEAIAAEGGRVRNIVFMGMGEPFHNEAALYEAIDALTAGELLNHAPSRILVSTVGIPAAMLRFAERYPAVNQALSLHAVRQSVREEIIPLARKYPLDELRQTLKQLNAMQPSTVLIEYLMLAGLNDSLADAAELIDFLQGLAVHVNLIPFNPIDGAPHLTGSTRPTIEVFANALKGSGLATTIRYSMGADIEAACGQLVQRLENSRRVRVMPDLI